MRCVPNLIRDDDCTEGFQQACAKEDFASSSVSRACYVDYLVPISWPVVLVEIEGLDLDPLPARHWRSIEP